MVRERLAEVINQEPDLRVCAEAADQPGALAAASKGQPHLAIVDLTLQHSHGIDLIKDLRLQYPKLLILVVSMHDESLYAERVLRAGAHGYMNKQEASRNIVLAIRRVLGGDIYLGERAASLLVARAVGHPVARTGTDLEQLTDRELQVFQLIGQGLQRRQVAEILRVDVSTVETYRNRIKEKLNLPDANAVLQAAIRHRQSAPPA